MAKRAKKSMLASVMSSVENTEVVADVDLSSICNKVQAAENVSEDKIVIDDACNANEELIKLSKENSNLKDKLAEYLDEISKLNVQLEKIKNENDSNILKIAELTFQIAKMKADKEDYQVLNVNSNNDLKPIEVQQSTNVPYMHQVNCNSNGYSDWN